MEILDAVGGWKKAHHVPRQAGAVAPGVHAAQWAGDPAAAHLEVEEKRRVSICFPGDGRAESEWAQVGWVYNTVSAARGG